MIFLLGEIAEEYDVSRQAVYDNIKRTEAMLEEYEDKLLLFEKFQERSKLIQEMKELIAKNHHLNEKLSEMVTELEKLD